MDSFLINNRAELIDRCKAKVVLRRGRRATDEQLAKGIPVFLEELIQTLRAEKRGEDAESLRISGPSEGDTAMRSVLGTSAAAHGKVLLDLGYTVEQVVHDYGDLCQAITDLAVDRDAPFAIDQFRTLNRCLDTAIADAVGEFSREREVNAASLRAAAENEHLGFLVHELRNHLHTATLAFAALESGKLAIGGSTAGLIKRNHAALATLLNEAVEVVRESAAPAKNASFSVAEFVTDAEGAASVYATTVGSMLIVPTVDATLAITGNRMQLAAALANLLQNAFKFTQRGSAVTLRAYGEGDRVLVEVEDHCGGLPPGAAQRLFQPFVQTGADRSGLGLGLSIARQSVEGAGGRLTVKDLPGHGCVFMMALPRQALPSP